MRLFYNEPKELNSFCPDVFTHSSFLSKNENYLNPEASNHSTLSLKRNRSLVKNYKGLSLLLCFILSFFIQRGLTQTVSFTPDTIAYSDIDIVAPSRGSNTFYNKQDIKVPDPNSTIWALDDDTRFLWSQMQPNSAGVYTWGPFDNEVKYCIDNGERLSFGVQSVCTSCSSLDGVVSTGGATTSYPVFVHNAMQGESVQDWNYSGTWIPNWNSESFLSAWETFLKALADHINTTSYKGVSFANVIYKMDIRGFGNWGEWHTYPWLNSTPSATKPTDASLKRIIDAHINAFPNIPLIGNVNMFVSEISPATGYYALTASNNWGKIGFRSDHLGDNGNFNFDYSLNTRSYNGLTFSTEMGKRWQYAPVCGEPMNDPNKVSAGGSCYYWDLINEVKTYHISQFSNSNGAAVTSSCLDDNFRAASKATGYRLQVKSGTATNTGNGMNVTLNWTNIGVAPVYENWDVWFELRDGATAVWSGKSSFTPKMFLPGTKTVTDNFSIPVQGNYALYLIIKDPTGYRKPFPLTNKNRGTDGSYLLTYINVSASTNQSPVANAGANQTITLPGNSVTLDGSGSKDADGTIASYAWTKVSGPSQGTITNAAGTSTTATNLTQGTYIFKLTVTDNTNFTGSDSVIITVNGVANQLPVANAGGNQTIILPNNSVTLDGSGSDPDGSISSYAWSKVSGPSQGTISNAASASTTVTNLAQGTYIFKLTVKDNGNATGADSVTITVSAAANKPPIANAGANQTITLPNNSVTLNGSASSDADGSISSYTWSKVSGPSQGTISNTAIASTTATNLAQGTYIFKLTVKDNSNSSAADSVIITVNAAANQPPVANAGANQTITLPNNSVTLNGSASSDADGSISSYAWSKVSGPTQGTISNSTSASTTVTNLAQGTYIFRLAVKDNSNLTAADSVIITVNAAANQPPVANAGANQTITLPANTGTLNGSASSDADGSITSYTWAKISGPAQGTISNTASASTMATNLVQGIYIFKLTVQDNSNVTATDSVIITVNAAVNKPPVANAGVNQTITLPNNTASLNGSASSDADGSIASYSWVKTAGPTVTISNANSSTANVSDLLAGQYTFQLTITDNSGASAKATVKITVVSATDLNPVADAGNDQTITLPVNSIALNGNGSSDPDGSISSFAWTIESGPAQGNIVNANQSSATANNLAQGVYVFKLIVTDNNGNTGTDSITITVNEIANKPPVANAGSSQTVRLPVNNVTLDGTNSSDPDGTIVSYSWVKISGGAANISDASAAQTSVSGLVAGQYAFELTVTDDKGATSKAQVKITVNAAANQPPVANAGANQIIILPTSSVKLDGSGSTDADGTIISYNWVKITGGPVTIANSNSATPTVSGLQAGQYTFELTVTDNRGASTKAQVKVTVNVAPNQLPVANAGSNQTITLPTSSVKLDGSMSSDADGTIASFSWAKVAGAAVTITNNNTATPTVSGLQAGQYTFELTVTDNKGGTTKAQVKVTVNIAPNQLPVANAGANQTLPFSTTTVNLDGSKSSDPDGNIVTYSWVKVSGADVTITNGTTATPTVTGLQSGQYTFELTVTDNRGGVSKAQVKITVNAGSNQSPIANAGANQTIALPTNNAKLDGSKSSDPDGTIASYSWMKVSGASAVTIINVNTATPTISGLVAGQYTFELTVTDNRGASTKAQVKITVTEGTNQLPIANAGPDQTITLPVSSVKLDGSKSSDPDGTIVSYTWMKIDGASAVTISHVNTANPTVSGLKAGLYTFELTVTDNKGGIAKDQVSILVNPAPAQPPVANAGPDITVQWPESSAVLDGSASHDSQGNPLVYTWEQLTGPNATDLSTFSQAMTTISNLQLGEYTYRLTVRNSAGMTATDDIKVSVVYVPSATIEIYPNPATDIINIKVMSDSVGKVAFNIYDLNGRPVKRIELDKQLIDNLHLQIQRRPTTVYQANAPQNYFTTPVNINQLTSGVYILETIVDGRVRVTSKFIKH